MNELKDGDVAVLLARKGMFVYTSGIFASKVPVFRAKMESLDITKPPQCTVLAPHRLVQIATENP